LLVYPLRIEDGLSGSLAEKSIITSATTAGSNYFAVIRWNKVARASSQRSLATVRNRPKRSTNFDKLAIQLSLDDDVTWLEFVEILPLPEFNLHVTVGMIVADRGDGRVAFDIVDERSPPDGDAYGLLLLALEHHQIRLVEIDDVSINKEPRVSNSLRIWRHRGHRVERGLVAAINGAFVGRESVSIRRLGTLVGLSDPLPIVSALMCRGVLEADLSAKKFGSNSLVARRWGYLGAAPTSFVRRLDYSKEKAMKTRCWA
jgi:hypothetical protein